MLMMSSRPMSSISMPSTSTTARLDIGSGERGIALRQRQYVLGRERRARNRCPLLLRNIQPSDAFMGDTQPQERWMNWDRIAGNWKQFAGKAKEQWAKLSDDDWTTIAGKRDQL